MSPVNKSLFNAWHFGCGVISYQFNVSEPYHIITLSL